MNLELEDKTALVSGSTAGIGLAIAAELAREGATVVVNGRTQKRVDAAIAQVRGGAAPGTDVRGVAADLGTAEGARRVVAAVPEGDILVNNMGIFEPKAFAEISDADWLRFFETNVLSGVRLTRAYLAGMVARGFG